MHALEPREIVEPVAVLQRLKLGLEDVVECRAEQATEQRLLLGEAADPQVDSVEACDRAGAPLGVDGEQIGVRRVIGVLPGAVHEVEGVLVEGCATDLAVFNEVKRRRTLVDQRNGIRNRVMRAVGGHEIDQRGRVLEELAELVPVRVGLRLLS